MREQSGAKTKITVVTTGFAALLYALFNTGVYFDSGLNNLNNNNGFGVIHEDYQDIFKSRSDIIVASFLLVMNFPLLISQSNTYMKKVARFYAGSEISGLPTNFALLMAAFGSVTKSITSSASTALSVSEMVINQLPNANNTNVTHRYHGDSGDTENTALVTKLSIFAAFSIMILIPTCLVNYAIGFNEAKSKGGDDVKLPKCSTRTIQYLTKIPASVHATVANTPSNIMYVKESHRFVTFIARFINQQSEDQYSSSSVLLAVSFICNIILAMSMQVGYNENYRNQIERMVTNLRGGALGESQYSDCSGNNYTACIRKLYENNASKINWTAAVYKSIVMTFSAFMLVYKLASNKQMFDSGIMENKPAVIAGIIAAINLTVCVIALNAFLFDSPKENNIGRASDPDDLESQRSRESDTRHTTSRPVLTTPLLQ